MDTWGIAQVRNGIFSRLIFDETFKSFISIWDIFNRNKETFLFANFKKSLLSVEGPKVQKISFLFFSLNS